MPNPPTATGPNGEKVVFEDGEWKPMTGDAAPRALPRWPTAAAAGDDKIIRQGLKQFGGELVANIIGIPHAAGELLSTGAAGLRTAGGAAMAAAKGEPINLRERFRNAREYEETHSIAKPLMAAPEPTGDEVLETVGIEPATNPIARSAGRTGADVATLMALKPVDRMRKLFRERTGAPSTERRARLLSREGGQAPDQASIDSAAKMIWRGTGRAAEAGFEGAVVGALGDGDPLKTAAWSAGIQAGGSAALTAKSWVYKNPSSAFLTLIIGHEMYKAVMPGPQDFFESKDQTINEMVGAYGLGALASLAGASRPVQPFARALSNASRPAIASVVTQLQEAGDQPQYERVLGKLSEEPDYFGQEVRIRLERAARSEKPKALLNEIDTLMKSTRFRRLYDELGN